MKNNNKWCGRNVIGIAILGLLIFTIAGCGGGGGSSQVIQSPPLAPSGVNVVVSSSTSLTISWNSVAGASYYNVYWSNALGVGKNSAKISNIAATSYTHTGRVSGATYYYVVTAVNSFGEGGESVVASALLAIPRPPAALAIVAGNGQATLSWNTNGAVSYNLYMDTQSGVTKSNYTTLYSSMTGTYTVTGLANATTYYFVVTSVNSFGESGESSEVAVTPAASSGPVVTGFVKYEDKEYYADTSNGKAGFSGNTTYKAVRYATVEAVNTASGTTVISGVTDATGAYTLTLPAATTVYIRVVSSVSSPASSTTPLVDVKDLSNALYAVPGPNFTASGTVTANISVPTTNPAGGAFNMLDVFTSGAQFYQSVATSYPPLLTAFWQAGNSLGTYYCSGTPDPYCPDGEGIYVLNSSVDTDEYDDDVLWHEYGHFMANHFSRDDSPGGAHYISSNDLDLRLSWSEGWGDFSPTSVKDWLSTTTPSLLSTPPGMATTLYVDTSGSGGSYFDFGNPPGGTSFDYASNEAAVTKILIGLRSNFGMQSVWDTLTSTALKNSPEQVNLEVFFDAWNSLGKADITGYFSNRLINYSDDVYEAMGDNNPNNAPMATLNAPENHTLFGSGDVDYVAFNVPSSGASYTITTSALKNGADTYIEIIGPDPSTAVVAFNDNASGISYANSVPNYCDPNTGVCHENGSDILGSTANFTAPVSGTYYAKIMSSPNRPLSAGKYGDYTLKISSP